MPAVTDPAFRTAGKQEGVEVWRVRRFKLEKVDKAEHGNFFGGDSYIVLSTYGNPRHYSHNVHYWLGEETTVDESTTAAIKTVELDDLLGGGPVQYREVQNHESSLFLSYFKTGIKYLKGGYESGFRHVDSGKFRTRLFQCKGKRNVRVTEVALSRDSLNMGDVFILDEGKNIYLWIPPEAGRVEKVKGIEQAKNIRDHERGGRGRIEVCDSDWDSNTGFWDILGGFGKIKSADEGGKDDEDFMKKEKPVICLFRVSDQTGQMKIDQVAQGNLNSSMLDSNDAFILDAASGGVFVWVGRGCTMDERKKSMIWATDYLKQKGKPSWVQVIRVIEGAEPTIFTQWFSGQTTVDTKHYPTKSPGAAKASAKPVAPPRAFVPTFTPKLFQCSDASGKITVEEISNFQQEDLDQDDVMILDGGSSIFVWNGSGSTATEKKVGQLVAKKYLETDATARPPGAKVSTVEQGREADEFTKHFPKWSKAYKGGSTMEDVLAQLGLN